jgi:hypothetical protein
MKLILNLTDKVPKMYTGYATEYFKKSSGYINISPKLDYTYNDKTNKISIEIEQINFEKINILFVPYTLGKFENEEAYRLDYEISESLRDLDIVEPKLILYKPNYQTYRPQEYTIIHKT